MCRIVWFEARALLQIQMAALRIRVSAGPSEPRRRNLAGNPVQLGLDLIGFSSTVLPIGHGCDFFSRRNSRSAAVACHGFAVDSGRRKSRQRASSKNGVVCTVEDSVGGESTLCVPISSETLVLDVEAASGLGQDVTEDTRESSAGMKRGGKLWRRLRGGKKLVRHGGPRKDRQGPQVVVNEDDVNVILSCITLESSTGECNSVLICL
jgi:hypothetical protein